MPVDPSARVAPQDALDDEELEAVVGGVGPRPLVGIPLVDPSTSDALPVVDVSSADVTP